jgi:zinc/manganese transport system ATP-binding protein
MNNTVMTTTPAVSLRGAQVRFGRRVVWAGLDLDVRPGEFLAVLGPNGSGKTTLLRVLLGVQPLTAGEVLVDGAPVRRGGNAIGYIPQQKALPEDIPLRAADLVGLGLDGHRWGLGLPGRGARGSDHRYGRGARGSDHRYSRADRRRRVAAALDAVGATRYAKEPVGRLSGGEQQRLRVAQALVGDPRVLLCDEPLLSLDLAHQRTVSELIDKRRRDAGAAVVFVTHEINPVLPLVDRVLYLVDGRFRVGTPEEVMTSATLSELYRTDVEVLRVRDRLVVVGVEEQYAHHEAIA